MCGLAGLVTLALERPLSLSILSLRAKKAKSGVEWKTDEDALKVISKADVIFAGHSQADHIDAVPSIAKKFWSKVIGSRTTANVALTARVEKSQLVTISGGEKLDFDNFSVQVIESEHGGVRQDGQTRRPNSRKSLNLRQGLSRAEILSKEDATSTISPSASIVSSIKAPPVLSKRIVWDCAPIYYYWRQPIECTICSAC